MPESDPPSSAPAPSPADESHVFAALGESGFQQLVAAFYRRVREDEIIGPLYPEGDWTGSEKRLGDFLIYRFGGPQRYIEERGSPMLRARHQPFAIGTAQRDRWLELMGAAMEETKVPPAADATLRAFFTQVAEAMRNRPY